MCLPLVTTSHLNALYIKHNPYASLRSKTSIFNALLWSREPRASINTPGCGWATETKDIKSGPHPFGAGAYTASNLVHETNYIAMSI